MKVIHLHIKYLKRSKGDSVVGFASYCSGEKLYSRYDGQPHYHKRLDVLFKTILLPPNAPEVYKNRESLWNAVELAEGKNGQLARTIDLELPRQLSRDEQTEMLLTYVKKEFVSRGMCADIAVHDKGTGNPHAHIILTLREIDERGKWQPKWRKNYLLDETGNKIYDPQTKRYECGPSIPTNDWNDRENAEIWRKEWAELWNREYERKGIKERVTHESYKRQGKKRKPQVHQGRAVTALAQRGIDTDRSIKNKEIIAYNRLQKEKKRKEERSHERSR